MYQIQYDAPMTCTERRIGFVAVNIETSPPASLVRKNWRERHNARAKCAMHEGGANFIFTARYRSDVLFEFKSGIIQPVAVAAIAVADWIRSNIAREQVA